MYFHCFLINIIHRNPHVGCFNVYLESKIVVIGLYISNLAGSFSKAKRTCYVRNNNYFGQ